MNSLKNVMLLFVGFMIIVAGVLAFKQYGFYSNAQKSYKNKQYVEAIDNYAMVVYMHLPLSPLEKKAIDKVMRITQKINDNTTLKLYALERLRSSLYATRSFYTPHRNVLDKIDKEIITIKTSSLIKAGYKKSQKEIKKDFESIMSKDLAPNTIYAFISIAAFFFFIILTIAGINKSTKKNEFNILVFLKFFPFILLSIIVWMYFLWLA